MTIFELVKIALDELYEDGGEDYGGGLDAAIKKRMTYLKTSYGSLNSPARIPVDYKDPATRFAYVYKYVAAHGDYIVQILENLRSELGSNIFQQETLNVTCVGGGPGSDIIGILKYFDEYQEPVSKIACQLLDKQQAWADTWSDLGLSLNSSLYVNSNFQRLDVTDPDSWQYQKKFLRADLFTMSYFVSEVMSLDQSGVVTEFWKTLFEKARPGSLFLYDDNGHTDFTSYFDKLWKAANLECLLAADNKRLLPRFSEQSSELGVYLTKFGQNPKIQSQITYRVLKKT